MPKKKYVNFDLTIERLGVGNYRVSAVSQAAGEETVDIRIESGEFDSRKIISELRLPRVTVRSGEDSYESRKAKAFGQGLFEKFITANVHNLYLQARKVIDDDTGLRIRLNLSNAAELVDLPWEFLYDPVARNFVALSTETPVTRYLSVGQPPAPLTVQLPLKMLVVISSPRDLTELNVEAEKASLQAELAPLIEQGSLQIDFLEEASLLALHDRLRNQKYHILHFIGHGDFDPDKHDGIVYFEKRGTRKKDPITGEELGTLLYDHRRTLRLVLLNSCEGGRTSETDLFTGTAQSLVLKGIPAVIAMQYAITDRAALLFTAEFYNALCERCSVDEAVTTARASIFSTGQSASGYIEWATPVLYLRSDDGRVFRLPRAAQPAPAPQKVVAPAAEPAAALPDTPVQPAPQPEPTAPAEPPPQPAAKPVEPVPQPAAGAGGPPNRWRKYILPLVLVPVAGLAIFFAATWPPFGPQPSPTPVEATTPVPHSPTHTPTPTQHITHTPTVTSTSTLTITPTLTPTATLTEAGPLGPQLGDTKTSSIDGMVSVFIPAGEFLIGTGSNDFLYPDPLTLDEKPQRTVFLDAYWIDQTEVTNAMFTLFVGQTGYVTAAEDARKSIIIPKESSQETVNRASWLHPRSSLGSNQGPNFPVVQMTWADANAYCEWAGGRLPTEAEWEKAARGSSGQVYPWGDRFDPGTPFTANIGDRSFGSTYWASETVYNDGYEFLSPVGKFPNGASPYGLMDMAGNAWEWVADWYDPEYYANLPARNPTGPASGTLKVLKGGSFVNNSRHARSANRLGNDPAISLDIYGFRCVRP